MLYVVEPICRGQEHVPFCAAFLNSLQEAFPEKEIVYLGSQTQVLNVKEFLLINNVDVQNITFDSVESFNQLNSSYLEPFNTLREIKKVSSLKNIDYIFISTASLQALYFLYLTRLFFDQKPIYAVLHRATTQLKSTRWFVKFTARFFCSKNYANKCIYPIVLSEDIKTETKKFSIKFYNQLKFINHPFIFNAKEVQHPFPKRPKVGFLGLGSKSRGFGIFLKIAELSSEHADFYGIGMLGSDLLGIDQSFLKSSLSDKHLSQEKYVSLLSNMDFIIMPFQGDYYTLAVSGVFYDALKFFIPILFLDGVFSRSLIEKYGEIGISFSTIEDITSFLKQGFKDFDFGETRQNQRKCLDLFTTAYVSKQIAGIINDNHIENQECGAI